MWSNSRFANRLQTCLCLILMMALGSAFAAAPKVKPQATQTAPTAEMSFTKGDSREGSRIHIRVVGDSLYYRETIYTPDSAPKDSRKTFYLYGGRRRAFMGVVGDLPRYPAFGSCFGKDMGFYMVETPTGKFYRSLPEHGGKCYMDEPGIWSLFQDLDDLLSPPTELEYQEYTAS
jgi:hypothetical protein